MVRDESSDAASAQKSRWSAVMDREGQQSDRLMSCRLELSIRTLVVLLQNPPQIKIKGTKTV